MLLCRCLAEGESFDLGTLPPERLEDLWNLAEYECVLATLYPALAHRPGNEDAATLWMARLRRRYQHNSVRNHRLRQQTLELAKALNGVGIVPMVLKGGLALFGEIYDDPGAREMADVDLLVSESNVRRSLTVMRDMGYRARLPGQSWTFQANPMARRHDMAPIEIHRFLGEQRRFLPVDEVWRDARVVAVEDATIALPSPTHRVIHNIFHSEIQDRGFALRLLRIRQLCDLARLMSIPSDVDWPAVVARFRRHRVGAVLRGRVTMASRLLGARMPLNLNIADDRQLHRVLGRLRNPFMAQALGWWGGVTAPFKAHHIDLTYNCGTSRTALALYRSRHFFRLLSRHGLSAIAKAGAARRMYE